MHVCMYTYLLISADKEDKCYTISSFLNEKSCVSYVENSCYNK